jgi:hypothetical protein
VRLGPAELQHDIALGLQIAHEQTVMTHAGLRPLLNAGENAQRQGRVPAAGHGMGASGLAVGGGSRIRCCDARPDRFQTRFRTGCRIKTQAQTIGVV